MNSELLINYSLKQHCNTKFEFYLEQNQILIGQKVKIDTSTIRVRHFNTSFSLVGLPVWQTKICSYIDLNTISQI